MNRQYSHHTDSLITHNNQTNHWNEFSTSYWICRLIQRSLTELIRNLFLKFMRHYQTPLKIIHIILVKVIFKVLKCRFIHKGKLMDKKSEIRIEVRQGGILSPLLFLLTKDLFMKITMDTTKNGIQCNKNLVWFVLFLKDCFYCIWILI